jgi:hypothetical protein
MHAHEHNVLVPRIARLQLKRLHKILFHRVPRSVELQKHCILIFVVQVVENLVFCFELYNFMVLKFYILISRFISSEFIAHF